MFAGFAVLVLHQKRPVAVSISHGSIHGPTITPRPGKSSPQKYLQTFRVQFQYSLSFVGLLLDPEGSAGFCQKLKMFCCTSIAELCICIPGHLASLNSERNILLGGILDYIGEQVSG